MRIAQVAPLAESVPPKLYGGTERVVHWLTEELVTLGHQVTLFASGDSHTKGKLSPVIKGALRLSRPRQDPFIAYATLIADLTERLEEFDIIHCHIDWLHLPVLQTFKTPFLTTLHGRLDLPGLDRLTRFFPKAPFVSISDNQRASQSALRWLGTVYHGMPLNELEPHYENGTYLAFLGRLSPDKGAHVAIELAQRSSVPLRLAAKIPRADTRYVKEKIAPHIDGSSIRLIGEINDRKKAEFLGHAAALLFPIDWPEPFGLVMIEAMACGTPVIAFRHGSVPEIIEDGVTGFVVDSEDEALEAIRRLAQLDRRRVRREFERKFTSARMTANYLKLYEALASRKSTRPNTSEPELQAANSSRLRSHTFTP
jgi:glycosyltransferase involved in cell wall biosynthesis